mmetsp:Transcript_4287/g.10320  ORF Transcript_4287/g.10320 Transcript_4287/m.10320 type:complete len:219 (-) Transcript_4287:653-1309(-)
MEAYSSESESAGKSRPRGQRRSSRKTPRYGGGSQQGSRTSMRRAACLLHSGGSASTTQPLGIRIWRNPRCTILGRFTRSGPRKRSCVQIRVRRRSPGRGGTVEHGQDVPGRWTGSSRASSRPCTTLRMDTSDRPMGRRHCQRGFTSRCMSMPVSMSWETSYTSFWNTRRTTRRARFRGKSWLPPLPPMFGPPKLKPFPTPWCASSRQRSRTGRFLTMS